MSTCTGHSVRRLGITATAVALGAATVLAAGPATAQPSPSGRSGTKAYTLHYAINEPVCAQPKNPNAYRCFAMRRVEVAKGTPGAYTYKQPNAVGVGPAGGYTPDDLAAAYQYNPNLNRKSQVVAIIDWFDDPKALSDLNKFDKNYGLPKETSRSFRKVNENGKTSPLPKKDHDSSVEIALDIESVRAVCHTCRILLVEASQPLDADLAKAENRAVKMGATEISNSFGAREHKVPASVRAAYNHPGVVITASTGDDGWFGWDYLNSFDTSNPPRNAAQYPSTDPHVIAVGGTKLLLNNDGSRQSETVWDENGLDDQDGLNAGFRLGAGGGGCSKLYAAPTWQSHYPGYAAAGCKGKRLDADISADADPQTGFDLYDSFAPQPGWQTVGGTSLSSPVTAALFALAGGSGGAAYPASTLYTNGTHSASALFDVTSGGNGLCGGDTTANCATFVFNNSNPQTHNPNALGWGPLDCSFPRNNSDPATAPPLKSECNAVAGFDGPTGIGTPKGLGLYKHTNPHVTVTPPSILRLHKAATFKASAHEPLSGVHVTKYSWNWGDGKTTSGSAATVKHTFTKPGTYAVTLAVTDSAHQVVIKKSHVTVGKAAHVRLRGPSALHKHKTGSFSTKGSTDPNTGGKITKVFWKWGDGKSSKGTAAQHAYSKVGKYKIAVTLTDNTGVRTTAHHTVNVKS